MTTDGPNWPPPTGSPAGTSGWYLASDGAWYQSTVAPAPGYALGPDGRWQPVTDPGQAEREELWRSSRWGLGDVGWGALAYLVVGIVGGITFLVLFGDEDDELGVLANSAFVALSAVAMLGVPWLASRRKGLRSLRLDFGLQVRPLDLLIGLGFGVGALIGAGLVATAIDSAFGADEATSNIPVDALDGGVEFVAFFLATAVLTPIVEEVFFRGLLYRSFLKRRMRTPLAITATTAIFVVPHLLAADSWVALVSLVGAIGVLGASFNLACHLTGNRLAAPIVAHALVNGLAVVALAV